MTSLTSPLDDTALPKDDTADRAMDRYRSLSTELAEQDLTFLGSAPYVYHCHHFNLFHDQTIDDALGEEAGFQVKSRAAHRASRHLLADAVESLGDSTPAARLAAAQGVFSWLGHGKLQIGADASGGTAHGEYLHYSYAWREKYGRRVRRTQPMDAFAAGFAAAAVEVAFDLPAESMGVEETDCFVNKAPSCSFRLTPRQAAQSASPGDLVVPASTVQVGRAEIEPHLATPECGVQEERIATVARGLKDFVLGLDSDDTGLMQGFGVFVTRHLTAYYNATAFETLHRIERERPQMVPVVEELFGESGHVCVFYTLGNIMLSAEWEALAGAPSGNVADTVTSCVAICRALGFGHWTVAEVDDDRLVLRGSSNYEAPYYLARWGASETARSYFLASSARAMMRLAHGVDWANRPTLDDTLYQSLFKKGVPWKADITRCLTRGDDQCEVVVTRDA